MTTAEKFRQLEASPLIKIAKFYINRIKNNDNTFLLKDCIKSILTGKTPIKSNQKFYEDEFISWYKPDEIGSQMYLFEAKSKLSKYCYDQKKATIFQPNTLLINAIGDLGRMSILKHEASSNQQITGILFNENVIVEYAYFYLLANRNLFYDGLYNPIMPIINQKKLQNIEIVIPSLEEQKQLIDGLKLIEEIDSYDKINLLEGSSFDEDLKDFANKVFISKFLNISISSEITHQLDLIKDLRQAFLREAMQGILVSNEIKESATGADLLVEIKTEKAQLVKEKKIKKPKLLAPISEEEIPFDIPTNWTWCRLGEIAEIGTGATPLTSNSEYYINADIPWMTSSETSDLFVYKTEKFITKKAIEETNCKVYPINTLVIAMYGQGKTRGQITELKIEAATNQACATINIYKYNQNFNSYIKYYFLKIYDEIRFLAQGGAQPNLNMDKIRNTIISLPPLEIQERIVAKLDKLMSYCETLEEQVKQSQHTNQQLLQQVLREALGSKNEKKETNVLKIIPKQCNNVEKTVLAGYIINQSNTPDFGKVKFQKILHLTEYHCQIGMNSNYSKKVAGPHDTTLINNLVSNLQRFNFYKIDDKNKKHDFIEMSSSNELVEKFNNMFDDQKKSVNQIIELFSNKSWEFCELISTLYAVWNNRIINKEDITNELLTQDFLKWNESKIKFIDKIDYGIKWIKDHNLEPLGWGNIIE